MTPQISAAAVTAYLDPRQARTLSFQIYLGLAAFAWGIVAGLAQALDRVLPLKSTLWRFFPGQANYYQGLTAHGVLMVLVFTFAFMNGFMVLVASRSLERRANPLLTSGSWWLMLLGVLMAASQIITNRASVLFTMYPPLQATPIYYLGLVLVVVSTWLTFANCVVMYRGWRAEHPTDRVPLQAFTVLCTYIMWFIASLGVAIEVLVLLLPWSLGWVKLTDAQLARSLFWFSGHAIVYVWLLPAYVSWYTMIPKQVGGRLFSDALTRLTFICFLVLSIPTGFHHQYTDPGIPVAMKTLHLVLTFGIFFPSMMTAFAVIAALEVAGRSRGGTGLFGWIRKLPWHDPSVVAQLLAMIAFLLGGVSGLINASYTLNLVVHNSSWVPGHFHLTVGTAVALSFLGISYWLIPHLSGRALVGRTLGLWQAWLWFFGVLIFSRGQMLGGLESLPRRLNTSLMPAAYREAFPNLALSHAMTGLGGTIMFISGVLFFVVILATLLKGEKGAIVEMPVSGAISGAAEAWRGFDRWSLWVGVAIAFILIAYGPFFLTYTPNFVSPGWKLWGGPP